MENISKKFENWESRILSNGAELSNIQKLAEIKRAEDAESYLEFYDTKLLADGKQMPRCIVLRGDSVQVVPVLFCTDEAKYYTIVTRQRRIVDGAISHEFVGGMIDAGRTPEKTCSLEVKEELGMEAEESEFHRLVNPLSLCTSLLDEKVNFYYFKKELTRSELEKYHLLLTGINEEYEYIETKVVPLNKEILELPNVSAGTLLGTFLVSLRLEIKL